MSSNNFHAALTKAAQAVVSDNRDETRQNIDWFLSEHTDSTDGWMLKAWTADSLETAIDCIQRALELEPNNLTAQAGMNWIQGVFNVAEEHIEAERLEQHRLEQERLEQERLEAERLEAERLEYERLEQERLEAERLEAERLEYERLEQERLEAERLEAERLEAERLEHERLEAERFEQERLEAERLDAERLDAERFKQERLEDERLEFERLAQEEQAQQLEAQSEEVDTASEEVDSTPVDADFVNIESGIFPPEEQNDLDKLELTQDSGIAGISFDEFEQAQAQVDSIQEEQFSLEDLEPATEESVAAEAEEVNLYDLTSEQVVSETPVVDEPVAEVPVLEVPVFEIPVIEEPVAETPVAEDHVAEEIAVEDDFVIPYIDQVEDIAQKTLSDLDYNSAEPEMAPELALQQEVTAFVDEVQEELHVVQQVESVDVPVETPEEPTEEASLDAGKKPVILTVDDSATIRKLVSLTLREQGYEVITAADGVEALKILAERLPDLVLSDINMPRLGGYKLCKFIKKHERTASIPVVMLSGKDGVFDKMRGKMNGCDGFIAKPFETRDLIATIAQHLPLPTAK